MFGWAELIGAILDAISDYAVDDAAVDAGADMWADEAVGKSVNQQLLSRIMHQLWRRYKSRYWIGRMDELLRRRMNRQRGSRGNPYNLPNDFYVWLQTGNPRDIRDFMAQTVKQYLHKRYPKMSETIIDRTTNAIRFSNISKNQIKHASAFRNNQRWYYLTNTHHSDNTIYRIRRKYISADKLSCEMELRFMSGPQHSYVYNGVPLFVFAVMIIIPVTYLTKNGYLAGAWNFFWYSCLTSKIVNTTVNLTKKPSIPFFNKKGFGKGEIEDMRKMRLSKLTKEPIHRKIWHKNGVRKWFTKYMKKPTDKKTDRGTTHHLHPNK